VTNDKIKPGRKLLMGDIFGEALGVAIGAAMGHIGQGLLTGFIFGLGLGGLAVLIEHSRQPHHN